MSKMNERFWKKIEVSEDNDSCWLWKGMVDSKGYGKVIRNYKPCRAHRVSVELSGRDIPEGYIIRHTCDTPLCCNPKHLLIGTHQDNVRDKVLRGRQPRHEMHSAAKITMSIAKEIRSMYSSGINQTLIADRFGIKQQNVSAIVCNRTWQEL